MKAKNDIGIETVPDNLIQGMHGVMKDVGLRSSFMDSSDPTADPLWKVLYDGLMVPYTQNSRMF